MGVKARSNRREEWQRCTVRRWDTDQLPTWLWGAVYFSWPYRSSWHATLVLIAQVVISGALIGLVYEKVGTAKA
jgi:hypothetical protein